MQSTNQIVAYSVQFANKPLPHLIQAQRTERTTMHPVTNLSEPDIAMCLHLRIPVGTEALRQQPLTILRVIESRHLRVLRLLGSRAEDSGFRA